MRVLFRPDLGPTIGSGHAMRSLAIAEELVAGGDEVTYACDTSGLEWVEDAILARGCRVMPSCGSLVETVRRVGAHAAVVDSYTLPTGEYAAVRERGVPLLAIVDGHRRGAVADVLVDPGPSRPGDWAADVAGGQRVLMGAEYALVRREFRGAEPAPHRERRPLRVLVTFGGTDAFGVAPRMVASLLALGLPMTLTAVVRADLRDEVERLGRHPGQHVTVTAPGRAFPALVRAHDAVVSAAGSTSWELLALGAAAGLVCVAENQERYYHALPAAGTAIAIGTLNEVLDGAANVTTALRRLLEDAGLRTSLRDAARAFVDGRGGERVAAEVRRLA